LPRCFISNLLHWAFGVGRSVFGISAFHRFAPRHSSFYILRRRGQEEGLGNLQRAVELDRVTFMKRARRAHRNLPFSAPNHTANIFQRELIHVERHVLPAEP
jgi:hypothetical protein